MTHPASQRITQALLWSAEALEVIPFANATKQAIDHDMAMLREMQVAALNDWWRNDY